ncbi:MAG: hypothetical protein V1859_02260 [archaeon]
MTKIASGVWQRLRKAGIIDTYEKIKRDIQIKKAGPYKLMSISGIGVRVCHALLKNAGWDMPLNELDKIYAKLNERTKFEFLKKEQKKNQIKVSVKEDARTFIPEDIKAFLEFLNHKNQIKYQVFLADNGKERTGSGRNTYTKNIAEFISLAQIDNGKGIICVAIGEHGNKNTEDITNIKKLLALVFDIDVKPKRKIGYVSTNKDHLYAMSIAYNTIKEELEKIGFSVGLINDSGNGAHVFVKVNITIPEGTCKENLREQEFYRKIVYLEKKLQEKIMDDPVVSVDNISKDCVRRVKCPGQINKKNLQQIEDRTCRILYKAKDYAEEKNNLVFSKLPAYAGKKVRKTEHALIAELQPLKNQEVKKIIETNEKIKALIDGNIVFHGNADHLKFENGKIYCKSRSEAEMSVVTELVLHGIKNFDQINEVMQSAKIGKWQQDTAGDYCRRTFEMAMEFAVKAEQTDVKVLFEKISGIKK